jgi:DNA-binding beta-propeller fold protein YncE
MAPDNDPVQIPQIDSANFPEGLPELEQSPRNLTGRERRRRWWILAILLLLLALLSYGTYYWVHNRSLPTVRLGGITGAVQPPQYLYSIAGKGITAMDRPVGVGVAADGRVYVVDFGNRRISVFTNDGRYLFSFSKIGGGVLKNPVHLIVRGDEVWVSDRRLRQLIVFDLQGNYKRTFVP